MGDTVATAKNGYERIRAVAGWAAQVAADADELADSFNDDTPMLLLTALSADALALSARLTVFAHSYKEQLECILIDQ